MKKKLLYLLTASFVIFLPIVARAEEPVLYAEVIDLTIEEQIEEENRLADIELLAQLIEAEAGNQDLHGRRLVGDVVLNRVRSPRFPNTIEEVIFQRGQFAVIRNGMFDQAGNHISETSYEAARMAYEEGPYDPEILYFATYRANGRGFWKYGGHWFSY